MKVSDAFPSKYLKASDLAGHSPSVIVTAVRMEELDEKLRPVLYFVGKQKGLLLNPTNARHLEVLLGDEMDGWIGATIQLIVQPVAFKGRMVDGIRVATARLASAQQRAVGAAARPRPTPAAAMPEPEAGYEEDDIPW